MSEPLITTKQWNSKLRELRVAKEQIADLSLKHQVACDTIARQREDNEKLSAYIHATDGAKDRQIAALQKRTGVLSRGWDDALGKIAAQEVNAKLLEAKAK